MNIEINQDPSVKSPCPHCRIKERDQEEIHALFNRLSRIEGQVRGIRGMIERDAYCIDILTQIAAVNSAINALARELLDSHIRTCVATDLKNGHTETVDELVETIRKMMK